jgi:hypothetical protein
VFTNPEALARGSKSAPKWIAVDGASLCRLALDAGIPTVVVNCKNENAVSLSEPEIRIVASLGPPSLEEFA